MFARTAICLLLAGSASAVQMHQRRDTQAAGACSCLPWTDAYAKHGVECGQTFEMAVDLDQSNPAYADVALPKDSPDLKEFRQWRGEEFCENFFKKNKEDYCVKTQFMSDKDNAAWHATSSWCYVSDACTELHGGTPVPGTSASWKICQKDDRRLSDMTPKTIIQLSKDQDFDSGFLPAWAFPYVNENPMTMTDGKRVQELQKLSTPVFVWPKGNHQNPRLIVSPEDVYLQIVAKVDMATRISHPGKWWNTNCIGGKCMGAKASKPGKLGAKGKGKAKAKAKAKTTQKGR